MASETGACAVRGRASRAAVSRGGAREPPGRANPGGTLGGGIEAAATGGGGLPSFFGEIAGNPEPGGPRTDPRTVQQCSETLACSGDVGTGAQADHPLPRGTCDRGH